jgi:hypothetical protein
MASSKVSVVVLLLVCGMLSPLSIYYKLFFFCFF